MESPNAGISAARTILARQHERAAALIARLEDVLNRVDPPRIDSKAPALGVPLADAMRKLSGEIDAVRESQTRAVKESRELEAKTGITPGAAERNALQADVDESVAMLGDIDALFDDLRRFARESGHPFQD
ncbi:MAG TPA: hypothetical protein VE869_03390 [Gemmatimonas sp.]|nr:hypothetical protein [Gemmatimonas sp.]